LIADEFFTVQYPSGITVYAGSQAFLGILRTFNIIDKSPGVFEIGFLLLAMRTPIGAVHYRASLGQALGERRQSGVGFSGSGPKINDNDDNDGENNPK